MGFVPAPLLPTARPCARPAVTCVADGPARVNRRALLSLAIPAVAATLAPGPAAAAGGTGLERAVSQFFFPKAGFNAPGADVPAVDGAVVQGKAAQAALQTLKNYNKSVGELYADFKSDSQVELTGKLNKIFSISQLRDALNTVNEAVVDEEAQKESDKVVRGIIQDIGELEMAASLKPGTKRTQKKIERTVDWFNKLISDFGRLLSFYA